MLGIQRACIFVNDLCGMNEASYPSTANISRSDNYVILLSTSY